MECAICKRGVEEVQLYEGILDNQVVKICNICANLEDIPIIRKPSQEQLNRADRTQSVRERMERLSSSRGPVTDISYDQSVVQRNIDRLRAPGSKQHHPDVQDNYYWELNIARRRRKLSLVQISQMTGVPVETLRAIEQGQIPPKFEQTFLKLENFFGIKLLKDHKREMMFRKPGDTEQKILEDVRTKIGQPQMSREAKVIATLYEHKIRDKREKVDKIKKGDIDFSKRDSFRNVNVRDLADIRKSNEALARTLKDKKAKEAKEKENAMVGDDLDLEFEEE